MSDWTLVILAAGKGTRLGGDIPKPLVTIHDRPLISNIIQKGLEGNFAQIVIVISQYTQSIKTYFVDSRIRYVMSEPRGTADAVVQTLPYITTSHIMISQADDSFFYTHETLSRLQETHQRYRSDFTVGLAEITKSSHYKAALFNPLTANLQGLSEKTSSEPGDYIVCGLYAGSIEWIQQVFPTIPAHPKSGEYGIPTAFLQGVSEGSTIKVALLTASEWAGVNTPEELTEAMQKFDKQ